MYRRNSGNIQRKLRCLGDLYRKVKGNPRIHMLHWEAILMVMRKPAWGLALTVTISQHVLAKMILHHVRLLGQHLVEVSSVVEKLAPWSPHSLMDYIYSSGNGSQEKSQSGGHLGLWLVCTISVITQSYSCSSVTHTSLHSVPPPLAMGCFLGVLKEDWPPWRSCSAIASSACSLSQWDLIRKHLAEFFKATSFLSKW